jgi:hypothetical protein
MKYHKIIIIVLALMFNSLSVMAADNNGLIKPNEAEPSCISQDISKLDIDRASGSEIINYLVNDSELEQLFKASAGVWEGYSVEEHTLMVFAVFVQQFPLYQARYQFQVLPDVRLLATLKLTLALHDIGKPYAIAAGDKERQHEFTIPLLEKVFLQLGFSVNEVKLAKALVDNDVIGEWIQGRISLEQAKEELEKIAQTAGMSLINYIPLQLLFYTADAGSYPNLYRRVFTTVDDLLIPKKFQFQRLWNAINS